MKSVNLSTLAQIRAALLVSVSALIDYNSQAFYQWQENKLGNDLFLSDPDRADRIHKAAEHGSDGSTHAEHIEDLQEYANEHYTELSRACDSLSTGSEDPVEIASFEAECSALEKEIETAQETLDADLARLEKWHQENGTLNEQIG